MVGHPSMNVKASSKLWGGPAPFASAPGTTASRGPVPLCSWGTRSRSTGHSLPPGLAAHGTQALGKGRGTVGALVSLQAWEVRPPQPSGCLPSEQLSSQWDTRFLEQQGGVPQEVAWAPSAAEAGGLLPAVLQERAAGIAQALAIARNEARQRRHGMSYDTEGLLALEVADCLGVAASQ